MNDDDRIDRLPRWAQHEILNLRGEVERLRREAALHPGDSRVTLCGFPSTDEDRALPDRTRVRWSFPTDDSRRKNGRWIEVGFRRNTDAVEIRGDGTSRGLIVVPYASNVVIVSSIDHEDIP